MVLTPDRLYDEWFDKNHPRVKDNEAKSCLSYYDRNKFVCKNCGEQDIHTRGSHREHWCRECREFVEGITNV